jgi:UDP-2-acetamido-3-amino-2,3-dideoxy-glucuronate N-acetyltransferase
MAILQLGLGNFGRNHLRAWHELGYREQLRIAELDPARHAAAIALGFPKELIANDKGAFWADADVVDVVTGTESHYALCRQALEDGKDVFVEKPMTLTARQAEALADTVARTGRLLQVGYYYRYHPISQLLRRLVASGELGAPRYICGSFMGFKRARTDVGVMHTDGIHFIDLVNWLLGAFPLDVYAVTRDHFGRGLEDLAIALFTYPGDVVCRIEAGYIQPGEWRDKVVHGAMTTKTLTLIGSEQTATADYEAETVEMFDVHHELRDGVWAAINNGSRKVPVDTATAIEQVMAELRDFLLCVETRKQPEANSRVCGVALAQVIEALYRSASSGRKEPIRCASWQ